MSLKFYVKYMYYVTVIINNIILFISKFWIIGMDIK